MVQINDKKLLWSLLGAFLISSGVSINNGYQSLKLPAVTIGYKLGPALTALGWIVTALAITTTAKSMSLFNLQMSQHGYLSIFAIALIYWSSTQMNKYQTCDPVPDKECPNHLIAAYTGGWSLLALSLAMQSKFKWLNTFLATIAALLMISCKLGILPMQRLLGMVDGPGYMLYAVAWIMIALSNSL
jgi:hypothetical protein